MWEVQENKLLSETVIKQIGNFTYYDLTQGQQLLIDELILDKELKERYKRYGLCKKCQQPNTGGRWCQSCNSKYFQQNFKNWTSGNEDIDNFIQEYQLRAINKYCVLEWIPYENLTDIEYLAEGGFSKVYKAEWVDGRIDYWNTENSKWERNKYFKGVVLKILNNSQNITAKFLQEITYHKLFGSDRIIKCYGISQEPATKNYVMVMNYMRDGNLRQYLHNNYSELSFGSKLYQLYAIANGLNSIHQQGLIHHDFHSGNILNQVVNNKVLCYITDLGLCRPVNESSDEKIYGVVPYMAPEVLRKGKYTQAADIYSFGIISCEVLSGCPPYYDLDYDVFLVLQICKGLRPEFKIKIPQLLEDLIKRCWDADPLNRPLSDELEKTISDWLNEIGSLYEEKNNKNSEFFQQYQESIKSNRTLLSTVCSCKTYSQTKFTSKLLDFANLPKPQNSQEINDKFYKSRQADLTLNISIISSLKEEEQIQQQYETYQEIPPK